MAAIFLGLNAVSWYPIFQVEMSDVFSQDGGSSDESDKKASEKKKNKKAGYYYVTQESEEADTLKDKFWRDLEQGKINVFGSDMYSKVKGQGRASRASSINSAQLESEDSETSQKKASAPLEGKKRLRRSESARRHSRKNSTGSESSQSSAKSRKKSYSKSSSKKKKSSSTSTATAMEHGVQRVPKLIIKTESGMKKDSADGSTVIGTLVVKTEMEEQKTEVSVLPRS